jgi:pyruvate ferredoxin oxidoreductase gamma subunit
VEANIRTFERARHELSVDVFDGGDAPVADAVAGSAASYGYLEAPVGGTILTPGNTILKDLTASRQGFIPIFDRHACVDCGLCDLVCPDFCLVWEEERHESGRSFIRLRGIDYQYCKGCLKCIDACPTLALTEAREIDGYVASHTVPLASRLVEMDVVPKPAVAAAVNLGSRRNGAG